MTLDITRHPCFNDKSRHHYGRIHLPVAPKCNVQCNFCDRDFDCVNESRPGVTSAILSPGQALSYLAAVREKSPNIAVVGIAGPGDPFANATETLETLQMVRKQYPEMLLCVASNGLSLPSYVEELASLEVSHVTMTINAVDPEVGAGVYAWVRDGKRAYRGREGAQLLLGRQTEALRKLKECGVTVKINTIIIPGVNDHHVARIAESVAAMGADIFNAIGVLPVANTPFGSITPPSTQDVAAVREEAGQFVPLMHHCTRCRADAVGLLGQPMPAEIRSCLKQAAAMPINPAEPRPYVAVATWEGALVNQHLGEARQLLIYARDGESFSLIETRDTPSSGGGDDRWTQLADTLDDCHALLVSSAGPSPQKILAACGVRVVMMEGLIEEGLLAAYEGKSIRAPLRRQHSCASGAACAGDGMGCM